MATGESDRVGDRATDSAPLAPAPSIASLFTGFLTLGMSGFGGVLPLARHALVTRKRWMTEADFDDLLAVCQILPGGNILNLTVAIGMTFRGIPGAIAALAGLIVLPSLLLIAVGTIYARVSGHAQVADMVLCLSATAAGLLAAMAVKMAMTMRGDALAIVLAATTFAAIAIARVSLVSVVVVIVPVSLLLTRCIRR